MRSSVGAKHDELTWFSSPFYAQIRTRATWPNARPRAVSQVYEAISEAISEPVHFYCALKTPMLCNSHVTNVVTVGCQSSGSLSVGSFGMTNDSLY